MPAAARTSVQALAGCVAVLGCLLLSLPPSLAQTSQKGQDPPGRVGRLALIHGTVSYHTADENYWKAARRNYPVTTGASFWTEPAAHAAIDVGRNRFYFDSSTEFDVAALDDHSMQVSLPQGAVLLELASLAQDDRYEVDIPRGAITIASSGRYEIVAGD